MKQAEVVEGIRLERERLIEFLRTISADDWTAPSLCSQWRVRDVVAHLVGNVADVIAQNLEGAGSEAYNNRQVEERAALTPAAILAEWEEKAPRLDAFFAGMDAELWEAPLPGLGGTIGWGVQRLLEDLWVHAHDVRLPLDEPAVAGPGTQATLEVMASEVALRCRSLAPEVGLDRRSRRGLHGDVRGGRQHRAAARGRRGVARTGRDGPRAPRGDDRR